MSTPSQPLLRREGEQLARRQGHTRPGRRATLDPRHGGSRTRDPAPTGPRQRNPAGDRVPWHELPNTTLRYLPLAILATLSVTVVPAVLANAIVAAPGVGPALAALACAAVLSLLFAGAEAWAWKRARGGRGVVYSDLMLWNFVRRMVAERRLKRIGAAYGAAVGNDGVVRVELLEGIAHLLEIRNPYTYGHCRRVAGHAERMARAMRLSPAQVAEIRTAALVHDVGKVYTPSAILNKEGPLNDEEFEIVKRHAADGADMLAPVRDAELASIVRHHHERVDGSGYPDGLSGSEIPLGAAIIAVADTFDAITSHRPYRRARSQREALAVLEAERGRLLDERAVDAFVRTHSPRRSIASVSFAGAASARALQLFPGGLLGGASLAGVLPAVGAAGVLALAPDARYERAAQASAAAGSLQAAFPGGLEGQEVTAGPGLPAPVGGPRGVRTSPERRAAVHLPGAPGVVAPAAPTQAASGSTGSGSGSAPGGGQSGPTLPGGSVETPAVDVPTPPGIPPVKVPPVTVPPVQVPPVNLPPVSTPSVTTPQVNVGAVTVPSVTVPSVTVHVPGTPGVKVQ